MKTIDTKEYVSVLRDLVQEGHEVNMLISGSSMSPFLMHQRDYIFFSKPKRELKVGDMVFYQRDNQQFVMHRIHKCKSDGTYDLIGDAQNVIEHDIRPDQIFALITAVKRNGKTLRPGDFCWDFYEKFWIRLVPLRRSILRCYQPIVFFKKIKKPRK